MSNPFLDGTLAQVPIQAQADYDRRLAEAQQVVQKIGVKVGDLVTVSWKIDDNFGGGMGSHMGEVERLDTMIYVAPSMRDKGALKMSLASIHHIRIERSEATPEERDAMRDVLEEDDDRFDRADEYERVVCDTSASHGSEEMPPENSFSHNPFMRHPDEHEQRLEFDHVRATTNPFMI